MGFTEGFDDHPEHETLEPSVPQSHMNVSEQRGA